MGYFFRGVYSLRSLCLSRLGRKKSTDSGSSETGALLVRYIFSRIQLVVRDVHFAQFLDQSFGSAANPYRRQILTVLFLGGRAEPSFTQVPSFFSRWYGSQ